MRTAAVRTFLPRDPIERAISHYWFSVEDCIETLPIEQAPHRGADEGVEGWAHTVHVTLQLSAEGCYVGRIRRYEALFGRERLHIVLYENLVSGPRGFRALCRWLGVSDRVDPTLPPRNATLRAAQGGGISPRLKRELVAYFKGPTAALAQSYGLDLTAWTQGWASTEPGGRLTG